jgi:hypothetical protein
MYHSKVNEFLGLCSELHEIGADLFNLCVVSCFWKGTSSGTNGMSSGLKMFCATCCIIPASFCGKPGLKTLENNWYCFFLFFWSLSFQAISLACQWQGWWKLKVIFSCDQQICLLV